MNDEPNLYAPLRDERESEDKPVITPGDIFDRWYELILCAIALAVLVIAFA